MTGIANVRGSWHKSKLLLAAAITLLVLITLGMHIADGNALRIRFLKAPPDSIPADAALSRYAQSRGKSAYQEHCASCHGARFQGDPRRSIPNLADSDWLYGSGRVSEIERIVMYGIRSGNSKGWDLASMPAYATQQPYKRYKVLPLLPHEIEDVTAFVLAFRKPPTDAAAVERGAQLFRGAEKGTCWDCHGEDARGDTAIGAPDLTDNSWLSGDGSPQSIHDSIAFGLAGSCPAWMSQLSPTTIRALAAYVHSLSAHTPAIASEPPANE